MSHVGKSLERFEDLTLLRGVGRFADDLAEPPGCLHAAFLRAPIAHGRIDAIDTRRALALPDIAGVVTGLDMVASTKPFLSGVKVDAPQYALASDRVRYVGEPVAIVIASDRYRSEDALDLIDVAYTPMPATVDPDHAATANAPLLHGATDSNVLHERQFSYGDPSQAFDEAEHVVETTVRYPRNSCTPIETFVVLAEYNPGDGSYDVMANFQGPYTLHTVMARALGVPGNRLRLRTPPDSGGSYGVKQAVFPYVVALAVAAARTGRPVKWVEDRLEHLMAATAATNRVTTIRAALDGEGHVTALDYDQLEDCGAYLRAPEPATIYRMHGNMTGAYAIRNLAIRNRVVVTNKTPTGLMRGFGGPQVYFALERIMDLAAARLDISPVEFRRRNLVPGAAMPFATAPGAVLDSGDYPTTVTRALSEGGYEELCRRRTAARADGRLYGIGCAAVVEPSISNMGYITTLLTPQEREWAGAKNGSLAVATVSFDPSGAVTVTAASVPQGQGHRTVLAQVVASELGIDPAAVMVVTDHDTLKDPWSIASGNYSSRFAGAVAGAAVQAAQRLAGRLKVIAAADLNVPAENIVLADGLALAADNIDNAVPLARVAAKAHWSPLSIPDAAGSGLRETVFWTPPVLREPDPDDRINSSAAYGFIFDFCGVEIDRKDGSVRIDRYVTAHDAGRLLNPTLADGQIRGGFAHGLGAAFLEDLAYGPDGTFQTGTFADYCPPYATDMPDLVILHDQSVSPVTPTGAKGLGEGNCMSTPVCFANAVADAIGTPVTTLPLTKPRILGLLGETAEDVGSSGLEPADRPIVPDGPGHHLDHDGTVLVPVSREDVWAVLRDPRRMAGSIPGCSHITAESMDLWHAEAVLGVGPIKGRFAATISFRDVRPPESLRLSGSAEGSLGSGIGEGEVRLLETDAGTRIEYRYAVAVSGKVAAVGGRLLDSAARHVIAGFVSRLAALSETRTEPRIEVAALPWWRHLFARWFGRRS